jgi:4'-phosphopantetheinyl transferase
MHVWTRMQETWQEVPACWRLRPHEIHVFRARSSDYASRYEQLRACLVGHEIARAERYVFERDRLAFVVGRGLLRQLLSRVTSMPPDQLKFVQNSFGKPSLPSQGVHFNLSHSSDIVLIAMAADGELGVDVERIRHLENFVQISHDFFSPSEVRELRRMPESQAQSAFYACWTRKEAILKAEGVGLSLEMNRFDVPVDPVLREPWSTVRVPANEASAWRVADLSIGPEYAAAIATRQPAPVLYCWAC